MILRRLDFMIECIRIPVKICMCGVIFVFIYILVAFTFFFFLFLFVSTLCYAPIEHTNRILYFQRTRSIKALSILTTWPVAVAHREAT